MHAANRRLSEEMGFRTNLQPIFEFTYRAEFSNGLIEHEYDHVFAGTYDGQVFPDPEEVSEYCYKTLDEIEDSIRTHPDKYTPWFKIAFPRIQQWIVLEKGLEKIPVAC
jgi:isopentenyl-diphosphate delta-isomerase